jgi:hypothetical protein
LECRDVSNHLQVEIKTPRTEDTDFSLPFMGGEVYQNHSRIPTAEKLPPPEASTITAALHLGQPGLYQLVEVVREEQNRALVAKLATPRPDYHALCNDLVPGSCTNNAANIRFSQLSMGLQPVGVMGPREAVASFLVEQCLLPAAKGAQMQSEIDGLEEGLYLWLPRSQQATAPARCYVVIWPSNDSFAGSEHRCKF